MIISDGRDQLVKHEEHRDSPKNDEDAICEGGEDGSCDVGRE